MSDLENVIRRLNNEIMHNEYWDEEYADCVPVSLLKDALELLKAQESSIMTPEEVAVLQGFLLDIPSSASILNSVNCHAISLEDASRIIAICACACDVMSPSGFIHWLKERFMNDCILKEYMSNEGDEAG